MREFRIPYQHQDGMLDVVFTPHELIEGRPETGNKHWVTIRFPEGSGNVIHLPRDHFSKSVRESFTMAFGEHRRRRVVPEELGPGEDRTGGMVRRGFKPPRPNVSVR